MNTCKTCKWWSVLDSYEEDGDSSIALQIPGWAGDTHRHCINQKVRPENYQEVGGSGSLASYETIGFGPDFGCIFWEQKP